MSPRRPRLGVVDHGAGNLVSISQALERVGADAVTSPDPSALAACAGIVLPGVGSTGGVMGGLRGHGLDRMLVEAETPILGICVGMQVLFESSDEDGAQCLGLLGGRVRRLNGAPTLPHIGWNDVSVSQPDGLFSGLGRPLVYFVHSYAVEPADPAIVTATAEHGTTFVAAVAKENLAGVQFHPERSGSVGLRILARFVSRCRRTADAA